MRISDWSSDVCSSDLARIADQPRGEQRHHRRDRHDVGQQRRVPPTAADRCQRPAPQAQVAFQLRNPRVGEVPAHVRADVVAALLACGLARKPQRAPCNRSEEHTSELQSLMRIPYAVFYLKKKHKDTNTTT